MSSLSSDLVLSSSAESDVSSSSSSDSSSNSAGSAGSVSVVVPGVSARLKNVIVDETETNAKTETEISLITKLAQSRIYAKELSPLSNSFVPFAKDNELFYDDVDNVMINTRKRHEHEMDFRNIIIEDDNYLNDYMKPDKYC